MIDTENLERLIKEIFVDSYRVVSFQGRTWDFTPFTAEDVKREVEEEVEKEYRARVPHRQETIDCLDKLSTAMKDAGGITREIYGKYHTALNDIARTLTQTNTRISGGRYDLAKDDERSAEVTSFRNLEDGDYGEIGHNFSYHNIFGNGGEGTLFQREYDETNYLTQFRIFHQLHRASLRVATVHLDALQGRIEDLLREKDKGKAKIDLTLPYDADRFAYEKLLEFNEAFGKYVRLNVLSITADGKYQRPVLIAEFEDPHAKVAEDFIALNLEGERINPYYAGIRTSLWNHDDALDFYDRLGLDKDCPQQERLDNTDDTISTYALMPNPISPFFLSLLKQYIIQKSLE